MLPSVSAAALQTCAKVVDLESEGTPAMQVMYDNFTLQGAYSYLHATSRSRLAEACMAHLVEGVILYEKILVPSEVLTRNEACSKLHESLAGVIDAGIIPDKSAIDKQVDTRWAPSGAVDDRILPEFHHHLVPHDIIPALHPWVDHAKALEGVDWAELLAIELVGHPYPHSISYTDRGRHGPVISSAERLAYYTLSCIHRAHNLEMHYSPDPTREKFFEDDEFMSLSVLPAGIRKDFSKSVAKDSIDMFGKTDRAHSESLRTLLPSLGKATAVPLVFNYVVNRAKSPEAVMEEALRVRAAAEAKAFRSHCDELEMAAKEGNLTRLIEAKHEIEEVSDRWSKSLSERKATKKWMIQFYVGTEFTTPWFNWKPIERKPHFVFLHNILKSAEEVRLRSRRPRKID